MHPVYAEILGGPELFIVLGILALLFGGQQIPKLARSIGQAKNEFDKGTRGDHTEPAPPAAPGS